MYWCTPFDPNSSPCPGAHSKEANPKQKKTSAQKQLISRVLIEMQNNLKIPQTSGEDSWKVCGLLFFQLKSANTPVTPDLTYCRHRPSIHPSAHSLACTCTTDAFSTVGALEAPTEIWRLCDRRTCWPSHLGESRIHGQVRIRDSCAGPTASPVGLQHYFQNRRGAQPCA